MQQATAGQSKPGLAQTVMVLLTDSLGFMIYLAVCFLIASPFFRMHWSLGVIYLIPLVWGFFLFMVGPLAEDAQTPGQKSPNIITTRKDGKEYVKDGSTGGIGYFRATLFWIVTRGIVPFFVLWVLYTNFTYANLILVLAIYVASLFVFAFLEDSLFGLVRTAYPRETRVRARIRGFWEKRKIARPQLPSHAMLVPFLMLVGGIILVVYGAAYYQNNQQAALVGMIVGIVAVFLSQALLSVRSWARWIGIVFLIGAAVATFLYSFSPLQMYITIVLAAIFLLELLLDPTVSNAFHT